MVIMNDLEWLMLSYDVIYYEKVRIVMQRIENVALNLCAILNDTAIHNVNNNNNNNNL